MSKADCDANEVLKLQAEIERLEAEAAAMREALETVEWIFRAGTSYCPWCNHSSLGEHAADCQRQLALAADAGRDLLERLRRAEKVLRYGAEIADVLRQYAMNLSGFLGKQDTQEKVKRLEARIDFLHGLAGEIEAAGNVAEERE